MSARQSNGLRVLVALLGTVVPLAPGLVSGCGSSTSAAAPAPSTSATVPADATIPLVMVVTAGGGAPTSSSSGGSTNPFGDLPDSSSSGSGSGSGSDDGSATDAGPSDANPDAPPPGTCVNYVAPMCGVTPCDLRTSVCCVMLDLETRCLPNTMACDPMKEASVHCLQACECPNSEVCCGVANTVLGVVTSECQAVPDGGLCNPHPQTNTQASEQLGTTDAECTTGASCLKQTCEFGAVLNLCGLQSQDPFDCHL